MKKRRYIPFGLVCVSLLLGACTKEITVDLKNESGNPVLNCFLRPDTFVHVQLTKSNPVLTSNGTSGWVSPAFDSIPDATVWVYDNEVPYSLSYDATQNAYVSTWKPQQGHTYRTVCQFPNTAKEVSSEPQTVLAPKNLSSLSVDSVEINGGQHLMLAFSLNDDAATDDRYHVLLTHRCYIGGEPVSSVPVQIDNELQDPSGASGTGLFSNVPYKEIYPYTGLAFKDTEANGQSIQFRLPLLALESPCDGGENRLHAEIRRTSEAYHEYITTVSDYMDYTGGGNPFGTPIQIYNNINNGIGIWATYTASEHSIAL